MKSLTIFILGVAAGVYIDQTYNLPRVSTFVNHAINQARKLEEELRKSK